LKKCFIYDTINTVQRLQIFILQHDNINLELEKKLMAVSYKKLWKILIDKDMKKKDLCLAAGISHASMAKLGKNDNITTSVLVKICNALQCDIGDIMEMVPETAVERMQSDER
jgi:putative transcriptional regulator